MLLGLPRLSLLSEDTKRNQIRWKKLRSKLTGKFERLVFRSMSEARFVAHHNRVVRNNEPQSISRELPYMKSS